MPISCPIALQAMSTEQFAELDYQVMKHAFDTHNEIGRLADESIYQADFAVRIGSIPHPVSREVPVDVTFRDFSKTYYLDLVVAESAVYELKTVTALTPEHEAQLLNYLLLLDRRRGKLINFRPASVESRFVNAPMSAQERRSFDLAKSNWSGPRDFERLVIDLLRDWGTGLEMSLYQQAITHLLGGEEQVNRLLPLTRSRNDLGQQRFHLMDDRTAFRITTFERPSNRYAGQIHRLRQLSPLSSFHWINIGRKAVTFTTVD